MTKAPSRDNPTPIHSAGDRFDRLIEIIRTLRSPKGCAWDREQTLASLRPYVLEEAYEVVEAMSLNDPAALCEELGDLLLEVVFVAQVCTEADQLTIVDATNAIIEKLIRRHPHVFGDPKLGTVRELSPTEVSEQWDRIKTEERGGSVEPTTLLDGIPKALPSLLRASRIGNRTARVGFDWKTANAVLDKVNEEMAELDHAITSEDRTHIEEELGDLLFTVANLARKLKVDPESALHSANQKFIRRFRAVEQQLAKRQCTLEAATTDDLEQEWKAVKDAEPAP